MTGRRCRCNRRRPDRLRCTARSVVTAILAALAVTSASYADSFRDVLQDAGIEPSELDGIAALADAAEPADVAAPAALAAQVLRRLEQADEFSSVTRLDGASDPTQWQPGDLVRLSGTAVNVDELPAAAAREFSDLDLPSDALPRTVTAVVKVATGGGAWELLVADTPHGWRGRSISTDAAESVAAESVVIRPLDEAGQGGVALANRLAWFPHERAPAGWTWLASRGVDVASLDAVRHNAPFAPAGSDEAAAFRSCLQAVRGMQPRELQRIAASEIRRIADADDAALRAMLVPSGTTTTAKVRQETAQIAREMRERADAGVSSVAPMFLRPRATAGRLVAIAGVARRAVRVLASADEEDRAAGGSSPGAERVSHYELDVYPPDSQNMPVVCCVSELPASFPLGDSIREPVRVAGVFFKLWTYHGRPDDEGVAKRTRGPVVIAPAPIWQPKDTVPRSNNLAIIGGATFLVLLAALWFALVRSHRNERRRPREL